MLTDIKAAGADAVAPPVGNRGPPSLLVRVASAFMYIVPWIDILGLGREVYHFFTNSLLLYLLPGALVSVHASFVWRRLLWVDTAWKLIHSNGSGRVVVFQAVSENLPFSA